MKKMSLVIAIILAISGCSAQPVNPVKAWEYNAEHINTPNPQTRVRTITWRQVSDQELQQICDKSTNGRFGKNRIVGCAVWRGDQCTVITGINTSTSNLGHEIRHCYDYNFHD